MGILCRGLVLLALFLPQCALLRAQAVVGTAVTVKGRVYTSPPERPPERIRWEDDIRTQPAETDAASLLRILFRNDHALTLAENTKVTIQPSSTSLNSQLYLDLGTVRVVTSGLAGSQMFVRTSSGVTVQAGTSGFIVRCLTRQDCIVVGLYGLTEVLPKALAPTTLTRQFSVQLRQGQIVKPPGRMPDSEFQELVDSTTAIGTGRRTDRLARLVQPTFPERQAGDLGFLLNGKARKQKAVIDQPTGEFQLLPEPPGPPSLPRSGRNPP